MYASRRRRAAAIPIPLLSLAGLAVFLGALRIAPLRDQEAPAVFKATTELVLVDVQVLHKRTRTPVASLQPNPDKPEPRRPVLLRCQPAGI
jgi:hypothetical protein